MDLEWMLFKYIVTLLALGGVFWLTGDVPFSLQLRWLRVSVACTFLAGLMNGAAVISNGGVMPILLDPAHKSLFTLDGRHKFGDAQTHLQFLCDWIFLKHPMCVASLGDFVTMAAALCVGLWIGEQFYLRQLKKWKSDIEETI